MPSIVVHIYNCSIRRLRQGHCEFKASLHYIEKLLTPKITKSMTKIKTKPNKQKFPDFFFRNP